MIDAKNKIGLDANYSDIKEVRRLEQLPAMGDLRGWIDCAGPLRKAMEEYNECSLQLKTATDPLAKSVLGSRLGQISKEFSSLYKQTRIRIDTTIIRENTCLRKLVGN